MRCQRSHVFFGVSAALSHGCSSSQYASVCSQLKPASVSCLLLVCNGQLQADSASARERRDQSLHSRVRTDQRRRSSLFVHSLIHLAYSAMLQCKSLRKPRPLVTQLVNCGQKQQHMFVRFTLRPIQPQLYDLPLPRPMYPRRPADSG